MKMSVNSKPAPSLVDGPYPQRVVEPDSGFWASVDKLIAKRVFRFQWRRSRQRRRLIDVEQQGPGSAQMSRVIRAWEQCNAAPCTAEIVSAALALRQNRALVELEDFASSQQATILAALGLALDGVPVHLVYAEIPAGDAGLRETATALGLSAAVLSDGQSLEERRQAYACNILAVGCRQLMFDYLMDQQAMGQARGPLLSRLKSRLPGQEPTMLPGLACALLVGAREVLIDQAARPVGISEATQAPKTHVDDFYTEALSVARQLLEGAHWRLDGLPVHPVLTPAGCDELASLTRDLGPLWRGQQRSENIVMAALAIEQLQEGTDYEVNDSAIVLKKNIADFAQIGGIGSGEYKRLLNAKHEIGSENTAPPILKRLSVQHFFPRYLHLAATGWILQPRKVELERVYQLVSLPALSSVSSARAQPLPFRFVAQWQRALSNWLQERRESGGNVLLLSPDDDSRQQLHEALGANWQGVLQGPLVADPSSLVGGLFLSLTIDEALTLDAAQVPQSVQYLVFAGTPPTVLKELLVCHRYAQAAEPVLFASLEDKAFESVSRPLKLLCSRNRLAYNLLRGMLEPDERKGRDQVAAHDAYVRQALAFSGDTI